MGDRVWAASDAAGRTTKPTPEFQVAERRAQGHKGTNRAEKDGRGSHSIYAVVHSTQASCKVSWLLLLRRGIFLPHWSLVTRHWHLYLAIGEQSHSTVAPGWVPGCGAAVVCWPSPAYAEGPLKAETRQEPVKTRWCLYRRPRICGLSGPLVHAGALRGGCILPGEPGWRERGGGWIWTPYYHTTYVGLIGVTTSHGRTGPNTLNEGEILPASVCPR